MDLVCILDNNNGKNTRANSLPTVPYKLFSSNAVFKKISVKTQMTFFCFLPLRIAVLITLEKCHNLRL